MNKHGVVYINISGQLKYWKETKCRWQSLCRKKKYLPCLQKHYLNPSDVPSLKGLRVNILSPHSCSSLCLSPYELFSSCLLTPPSPCFRVWIYVRQQRMLSLLSTALAPVPFISLPPLCWCSLCDSHLYVPK